VTALPLLVHEADAVVAWRGGRPVGCAQFLADVTRVADSLPAGGHFINVCADRYRFAVGLAAGLASGRASLLPSTFNAGVVRHLADFAADAFVLADGEAETWGLPRAAYPEAPARAAAAGGAVPQIPAERTVAWVFTSGSTGAPLPHRKTWGKLVADVRAEAEALGLAGRPFNLVGTVPPQHMYGLESTVLLALQNGGAFAAERPFFPPEVLAAVAALPRPRMLVTTPFHLRNLLEAGGAAPVADLLLSATAPLSAELARQAETAFGAPLMEIYGSTESGQIASRRTVADEDWRLFPGIVLEQAGGRCWVSGGHVEQKVALADVLQPTAPGRFSLGGRDSDLVNIAGKRTSLAYLNHQLLGIDGVADGAFYLPEEAERGEGVTRLAAFVVAPQLTAAQVLAALRERVDPVFVPRPLVLLEALPRNATGKLPREACRALLAAHRGASGNRAQ
jgi:acyl-coenzyme A synthetase/AMP-(fatty) acid ligase